MAHRPFTSPYGVGPAVARYRSGAAHVLVWQHTVAGLRRGRADTFPSPATICYLAFYVLTLWGLLVFPLAPRTGIERATFWLDSGTVAVGGGMLVWHFVVHPLAMANAQDSLQLGLTVLSPVLDMVLLVTVLTVVLRRLDSAQYLRFDRWRWGWLSSAWPTCGSGMPTCRARIGPVIW